MSLDGLPIALQPGQKNRRDFSREVVLKSKLPKNHFNKKYAPKILFLNENKLEKFKNFDVGS